MGSLPGWMPILLDQIKWGCSSSPWFVDLAAEDKALQRGRQILLDLWPFIAELPENIAAVRRNIPEYMSAAKNLLDQLSDSERHYQKLFKEQFKLTDISESSLELKTVNPKTLALCQAMTKYCRRHSYVEGIHAIVVAELAATMCCRACLPSYEKYFVEKHKKSHSTETINSCLEWLRLHAKTQTRHALWLKRMLCDTEDCSDNEIPEAAQAILEAMLNLWECPAAYKSEYSLTAGINYR